MSPVYTWVLIVVLICTCAVIVEGENLAFVITSWPNYRIYKATLPVEVGAAISFTSVISLSTGTTPRQLGYDPVDKMIYWVQNGNQLIRRCDLDGNNVREYFTDSGLEGLALDVVNRIVYFTDDRLLPGLSYIDMDLNGPVTRLDSSQLDTNRNLAYIAFAPDSNKLYYTVGSAGSELAEILSINANDTDRKSLVLGGNLEFPYSVLLEENEQTLYVGDLVSGSIHSLNLQSNIPGQTVIYQGGGNRQIGLGIYKDDIYWCDADDDLIYRIAKDGSANPTSPIIVPATFDGGVIDGCKDVYFYIEVPCVSNLVVTADSASQLSVTWDLSTALCPADEYRVEYQTVNVDQCNDDSEPGPLITLEWQTQNSVTLRELQPFTAYRVAVTPRLRGDSSITYEEGEPEEKQQATGVEVSSKSPPGLTYVTNDTTVSFTWLEIPCGYRGGLIEEYAYNVFSNGVMIASGVKTTQKLDLDIPPCGSVTFQVAGVNSDGMSEYSILEFDRISEESFMPNTDLEFDEITDSSVAISWDKTACPASDYTVNYILVDLQQCQLGDSEVTYESVEKDGEASVTIYDLEPGSHYEIIVSTMNGDGEPRQLRRDFTTLETVPSIQPANLKLAHAAGASARFTWDAIPCGSRGGGSFYYYYKLLVNGVELRSGRTFETSFTEIGLPCGQVEFQIAGATDAGIGISSSVFYDVNLSDTFNSDRALAVTSVTSTSAQISWTGSACASSPFSVTYVLTNLEQCQPSNDPTPFRQTTESSVMLTGLRPGSSYMVIVEAGGQGSSFGSNIGRISSEASFVTADGVPTDIPRNVQLTDSDSSSLSFSWSELPCGSRGSGDTVYEYELERRSDGVVVASGETTSPSVTIIGLTNNADYDFRVAAANGAGPGESSMIRNGVMTSTNARVIIGSVFSVIAVGILIFAAVNSFICYRRILQPRDAAASNMLLANTYDARKLPGITSPFAVQRQGLSAQFGYGYR